MQKGEMRQALVLIVAGGILLPVHLVVFEGRIIDAAMGLFEKDAQGVVVMENGVSRVSFEHAGRKYTLPAPAFSQKGATVYVCLPPDGDVSEAEPYTRRGPHTWGALITAGFLHFLLAGAFILACGALFFRLSPKSKKQWRDFRSPRPRPDPPPEHP